MKSPGPNSPCPCGSGRKYKKCCKRADAIAAAPRVALRINRPEAAPPRAPHHAPSASAPAGPTRRLQGASLDESHPSFELLESLLELGLAAGHVFVVDDDGDSAEFATAAEELGTVAQACCAVAARLAHSSPAFEAEADAAVRAADTLAQNPDSEDRQEFFAYAAAVETLNAHIVSMTKAVLTQMGVKYTEEPEFGLYWFSSASLSSREGFPWLDAELSVLLYPAMYASGGLFVGRASLWGLSHLELDTGIQALLDHNEESHLDPRAYLLDFLREIALQVEVEGTTET